MEDNAPSLELKNNGNPEPYKPAYHTSLNVPHPTNKAAKVVLSSTVLKQVMEAK